MASKDPQLTPTELDELLLSNEPLTHSQEAFVKEYVSQQENSLEQQRKEMEAISQQLSELLERKGRLEVSAMKAERDISNCKRLLQLSVSIPTEILQIIFSYSIPSAFGACVRHSSTYSNQPPHSLIYVCRRWRRIALDMPSLWTSFSIRSFSFSRLQIPNATSFREMVKSHYGRSKELPKSLDIDAVSLYPQLGHVKSVITPVFNNEDIEIKNLALRSDILNPLLHGLGTPAELWNPNAFRKVESLVLYSRAASDPSQEEIGIFSPERLKALRRLSFRYGHMLSRGILDTYAIPWKNLTHVAITSWLRIEEWKQFFPKLASLEQGIFYIAVELSDDDPFQVHPVSQHPTLSDLTLIFQTSDDYLAAVAFEPYGFPQLQHLRLGAYQQRLSLSRNHAFFDLHNIQNTLNNLTSLSLCPLSWETPAKNIIEILILTPSLLSLTIGVSTNYDRIFEQFQVDWNGFALVPSLEEFVIDCIPNSSSSSGPSFGTDGDDSPDRTKTRTGPSVAVFLVLTAGGFTGMVKDRWRPLDTISQLKKVSLFLPTGHENLLATVESNLKEEVKEGLDLTVRTSKAPVRWVEPMGRQITHWHEGLVLPEESDCAACLNASR
ncbi:hypothetical protein H1R20_g4815, partial [Candolleomyces eurysporus]